MGSSPQIHLLFGFLGSGKTTLVKNLLQNSNPDIPTAVIVNEFGEVGIDGEIIQGNAIDTVELVSGCICCTLKGSLLNAIEELAFDKGAKRIIIESTGVADPEDMLDDLEEPEVAENFGVAPIVTIVDGSKFRKILPMLGEFYESQIWNADIVIVNKIDLSTQEDIETVVTHVHKENPHAEIRFTEYCDVESSLIFSQTSSKLLESQSAHHHHHHHQHAHETMMSFVVMPNENLTEDKLRLYCAGLPDKVWRMKGHLVLEGKPCLVQYSAGQLDISSSVKRDHYRVVVIGQDLNPEAIARGLGTPIT